MKQVQYRYYDTNGNVYMVQADSLNYEPISPAMSSSGIYSGGEAKEVALQAAEFQDLQQVLEEMLADSTLHLEKRTKPSVIVIRNGDPELKHIIQFNSSQRSLLESRLQALLKKD